jgi:quercetin dioxygenase-like cupin family protein
MDLNNELLHTPDGMRDTYGTEMAKKNAIMKRIRSRIRLYGYEEIQTPTIEFYDVFSSEVGTTPVRELYKLLDNEGNLLVLRPDFTPSVARCAAKYFSEDTAPIRFSYAGSVFGNTSSLQGKLAEPFVVTAPYIEDEQDKPIHLSYHKGNELDYIISGHLRFAYENHVEEVGPGDVLMYDSGRGHGMIATGGEPCVFLAIVMKPEDSDII